MVMFYILLWYVLGLIACKIVNSTMTDCQKCTRGDAVWVALLGGVLFCVSTCVWLHYKYKSTDLKVWMSKKL